MIRAACLLLVMTLLAACADNTSDDFAQMQRIASPEKAPFDPRFVALSEAGVSVPALQVATLKEGLSGVVLLESRRDGVDTWLSRDGASLIMRQGMLVGTRGFGGGLTASDIDQPMAMIFGGQQGASDRFMTFLNGNDEVNTRTYRCEIKNRGAREISVGGKPKQTRLMAEDCRSLDQSFLNLYWIAASGGGIVQTRQWAGDYTGIITTRVVPR